MCAHTVFFIRGGESIGHIKRLKISGLNKLWFEIKEEFVMNHCFKKFVSLFLVVTLSTAMSVTVFAADQVSLPQTKVETGFQETSSTIAPKKVVSASGTTYGPWFGYRTESFSSQGDVQVGVAVSGVLLCALSPQLGATAAASIIAGFGAGLSTIAFQLPDDYVYGTIYKRQREVYINGEFAYFQTDRTVKAYMYKDHQTTYLGTVVKYFEGDSPALKQN